MEQRKQREKERVSSATLAGRFSPGMLPTGGSWRMERGRESRDSLVRSSTSDPVARYNELSEEESRRQAL